MTPQCRPGRAAGPLLLACCLLTLLPACVYFNTYYNAQKYFRQAEKARKEQEKRQTSAISTPGADRYASAAPAIRNTGRGSRGAGRPGASRGTTRGTRRSGGSALALYDKAARKASLVLEEYESRESVDESDLIDDAMFLMGRAFYWQAHYKDAAQSFNDLETNFPKSEFARRAKYWRGLSYEGLLVPSEAEPIYRSLMTEAGEELAAKAALRLGELAIEREDYGAAVQEFRTGLEAFPNTDLRPTMWVRLGEAHRAMDGPARRDSAIAAFDHALREGPSGEMEYQARLNRGRVLYEQGKANEAQLAFSALLGEARFRSFEGQTRLLLGQFFQDQLLLDEALDEYTRVRDDFPLTDVSAMALYRTGMLYLQEHSERGRAQEYLEEVAKEKQGSEGAVLAQEVLKDLGKLDRLRTEIHVADSLAAATDSLAAAAEVAQRDTLAAIAGGDSMAVQRDSLAAIAEGDSMAVQRDTLAAIAGGDSMAVQRDSLVVVAGGDSMAVQLDSLAAIAGGDSVAAASADSTSGVVAKAKPQASRRRAAVKGRPRSGAASAGGNTLLETHFAIAEMYRDRLAMPDSAAFFYQEILRRFPDSNQIPRTLYSIARIRMEGPGGMAAGGPVLEELIESFPESEHANAARRHLGYEQTVTNEEQAASEFAEIEEILRRAPTAVAEYLPLLDELARRYPRTLVGARSIFLTAWTYENIAPTDTLEAERRFSLVLSEFPESPLADVVRQRREAQRAGLIAKLERQLRTINRGLKPGERIEVIAVEPDSADSVLLAHKYMGFALRAHRRGRLAEASELYELSLDQQQGNPLAQFGMGEIAWEEGYFEVALDHYREALRHGRRIAGLHYRLFAHHAAEGREDSANHYLREIVRRDRSSEKVQQLRDEFPHLGGAEPEDLELSILQSLDLSPPEEGLDTPPSILGLKQNPMVRTSVVPKYPAEAAGDSAEVILDILISADGMPDTVEVFEGDEPMASAAAAAARQYVFYPAEKKDGDRPYVWVELAVPVVPPRGAVDTGDTTALDLLDAVDTGDTTALDLLDAVDTSDSTALDLLDTVDTGDTTALDLLDAVDSTSDSDDGSLPDAVESDDSGGAAEDASGSGDSADSEEAE